MAFHVSNFGQFGTNIKRFTDIDGYVPEWGDKLESLAYPMGWFDDENATIEEINEEWREFVAEAVEATNKVESELRAWREQ